MDVDPKPPIHHFDLPNFTLHSGTTLPLARLAYLDINPSSKKVALIPTCFRGKLHTTLTFSTGALRSHRVIAVALFGNGESSSPSNTPPTDAEGDGDTPSWWSALDYRDCVRAQHALLTSHLGITTPLDVVVGFSMAGQCAYHWTAMHPTLTPRAVLICTSARTSRHNWQMLEGPRAALTSAIDYSPSGDAVCAKGVGAFAKAYCAWLYSAEWFEGEKWREMGFGGFGEWEGDATGAGGRYKGWFGNDLLALVGMWQRGDVSVCFGEGVSGGGDLAGALGRIGARVLLMPCRTDQYFRWEVSEREAKMLGRAAEVEVIPSVWGHVAGGGSNAVDNAWMDGRIARFLQEDDV